MSLDFDLPFSTAPTGGFGGSAFVPSPKYWHPLSPRYPVHAGSPSPEKDLSHSPPKSPKVTSSITRLFRQLSSSKKSQSAAEDDSAAPRRSILKARSDLLHRRDSNETCEKCLLSVKSTELAGNTVDELDMALAMASALTENKQLEDDDNCNSEKQAEQPNALTFSSELLSSLESALSVSAPEQQVEENPNNDDSGAHSSSKVKFADELGFPLTAVLIFENETYEKGGDENGNAQEDDKKKYLLKWVKRYRLTKGKRHMGASEKTPARKNSKQNSSKTYKPYKPYLEERRLNPAGSLSMVGW